MSCFLFGLLFCLFLSVCPVFCLIGCSVSLKQKQKNKKKMLLSSLCLFVYGLFDCSVCCCLSVLFFYILFGCSVCCCLSVSLFFVCLLVLSVVVCLYLVVLSVVVCLSLCFLFVWLFCLLLSVCVWLFCLLLSVCLFVCLLVLSVVVCLSLCFVCPTNANFFATQKMQFFFTRTITLVRIINHIMTKLKRENRGDRNTSHPEN